MIGGTFEYLMSSLPNLSFENTIEAKGRVFNLLNKYAGVGGQKQSLVEILDNEVQKFLQESTFSVFQKIDLRNIHESEFQQSKSKVLSIFSRYMYDLKTEIKLLRISRIENDEKSSSPIEKHIGQGTPLEKEIQIMKYQWEKIEDLSVGHFADMEALVAYKVKLLILTRWWSFNVESGYENFTQMTTKN